MNYDPLIPDQGDLLSRAFRQARWRAEVDQILARLTGRSADLLCYWDAYNSLRPSASYKIGYREIPLARIVGSVERCADFTRRFLPLKDGAQQRWTRVKAAFSATKPLPPIQVYQVGEVYFVADGNHRVSVAWQEGMTYIHANVVQIQTKVPLSAGDHHGELLLKGEHARFLERTRLDEIRPQADLELTVSGRCQAIEAQIQAHRTFLTLDRRREIPDDEAVGDWYDMVYLPMVQVIRDQDLLRDFPCWTEADLYLALCEHRIALEEAVGQEVELDLAVADLARQCSAKTQGVLALIGRSLRDTLRLSRA